jgi:hypothetical protein
VHNIGMGVREVCVCVEMNWIRVDFLNTKEFWGSIKARNS